MDSATLIPKIDDVRKLIDRLVYSSAKCRGHEEAHIQVSATRKLKDMLVPNVGAIRENWGHKKAHGEVTANCWGHK